MTRDEAFKKWYDEDQTVYTSPEEDSYAAAFSAGADWERNRRNEQKMVARVVLVHDTDSQRFQDKVNYWAGQKFYPSTGTMIATPAGELVVLLQWTGHEEDAPDVAQYVSDLLGSMRKEAAALCRFRCGRPAMQQGGLCRECQDAQANRLATQAAAGAKARREPIPIGGLCSVTKGQHVRANSNPLVCVRCFAELKSEEALKAEAV